VNAGAIKMCWDFGLGEGAARAAEQNKQPDGKPLGSLATRQAYSVDNDASPIHIVTDWR
jgi:hypothetical protein